MGLWTTACCSRRVRSCSPISRPDNRRTRSAVSALEDACASRQWWAEQWPEGAAYVAGLVAQDVQDALFEKVGRWPMCLECDDGPVHSLYIQPDLGGPDPVWVCEETGEIAAPLGFLGRDGSPVGGSLPAL